MNHPTRTTLIGLSAVTALALAGCGGAATQGGGGGGGATGGPIKIGVLADLTGATGDVGTPYNEGCLLYTSRCV